MDVIDKNGKRVRRANGIVQDGDHVLVPLRMMDHMPIDPALQRAIDRARITPKSTPSQRTVNVTIHGALTPDERMALEVSGKFEAGPLRDAIHKRVTDLVNEPMRPGQPVRVIDQNTINDLIYQEKVKLNMTTASHRPGFNGGMTDADKRSAAIDARNAKMNDRWKNPPNVLARQVVPADVNAPGGLENADAGKLHPADRKDARLEQMWKHA